MENNSIRRFAITSRTGLRVCKYDPRLYLNIDPDSFRNFPDILPGQFPRTIKTIYQNQIQIVK